MVGGSRRLRHAHPLRPLGPPGAGVPHRARPGLGLREQRRGRRGAAADRRGTAEALLRRQLRRRVLVGPRPAARGTRPSARPVRVVDRGRRGAVDRAGLRRPGRGDHRGLQHGGVPRGQLRAQAGRPVPAGHVLVRQLRPRVLAGLGRAGQRDVLQQPHGLRRPPGRRSPGVAAQPGQPAAGGRPGSVGGHHRGAGQHPAVCRAAGREGDQVRAGRVGPRRAPRLAVLAGPVRSSHAAVLLRRKPAVTTRYLIGLLLGTEDDWPTAFTEILSRLGPVPGPDGGEHAFDTERITIEPFSLRDRPRYHLVIDRLAYWYYHPREWLKKVSMMDGVYLLNSPFTFQSMEKHAAYCAMIRLGLKVPETVLVPYKNPLDNSRYAYTAARYNKSFDLDAIAGKIGYPLFMKPYDGGAWRGVSRINNPAELHAAYDQSGEMLMHLQKAIDYDVFARSLSIGAETMVMRFQPELPMHSRYAV